MCNKNPNDPERILRKAIMKKLVFSYALTTLSLLALIGIGVYFYFSTVLNPTESRVIATTIVADVTGIVALLSYIYTLKRKSIRGLWGSAICLLISLTSRIVGIVFLFLGSSPVATKVVEIVVAVVAIINFMQLALTLSVWDKVPESKWVKSFDLTTKLSLENKKKKLQERQVETSQPSAMILASTSNVNNAAEVKSNNNHTVTHESDQAPVDLSVAQGV